MNDDKVLKIVNALTKLDETLDDVAGSMIGNFAVFGKKLENGIRDFKADM